MLTFQIRVLSEYNYVSKRFGGDQRGNRPDYTRSDQEGAETAPEGPVDRVAVCRP